MSFLTQKINQYLNTYLLLPLVFISFNGIVYSQPESGKVDVLSVQNGIDGLEVNNFFLDNDNKIWLSTTNCLNICTPKSVDKIYSGDGTNNIHSQEDIAQIIDNGETVDVFYQNTTNFYDRFDKKQHVIKKILINSELQNDKLRYIKTLSFNNKIYIASQDNNTLLIKDVYQNELNKIIVSNQIVNVIIYKDGYYLLTKSQEILSIDKNGKQDLITINKPINNKKFKHEGKLIKQKIQIFHLDKYGRLWYSPMQEPGVYFKNKNDSALKLNEEFPKEKLYTWISEDETGKLLLGSTHRYRFTVTYYILDKNSKVKEWPYLFTQFRLPKKLYAKDFYKEIFVSTYRNMIILNFGKSDFLIPSFVNEEVKNNDGAYGHVVWGISQINEDSIFVTSEKPSFSIYNKEIDKGVFTNNKNQKTGFYYSEYSPKDDKVYCMARKINDNKYVLIKIDPNTNEYEEFQHLAKVYSLVKNSNNDFYIGGDSKNGKFSIYLFNPETDNLKEICEISYKPYFMQYDERDNSLWCIDLYKGAYNIELDNQEKEIELIEFDKESFKYYFSLNLGLNNRIYISTGNGLYVWDKNKKILLRHISTKDGLSTDAVCTALETKIGNIWISTFSGLSHYYWDFEKVHTYFVKDGLANNEFNTKAFYSDDDNNFYFGNSNGLVKVDVNKFNNKSFDIYLDRFFTINNDSIQVYSRNEKETLSIHHNKHNEIDVVLGTKEWKNKESVKFYSYLYPYDKTWSKPTFDNKFSFKYLPPGEYKMHFKAINGEGVLSNTVEIPFTVYVRWYETSLFYIIALALLISGILISINFYVVRQKRRKERTKLQFEKRISELELGILQAQMNPHFVFNAISAIQAKASIGDGEFISQYLNDFASLMRLYLESSRTKILTLKNEIKLLNLYLNLEKMRFGDKLQYEINVDPEIDTEFSTIPSMILQPFVENSINHGLFHKKTQGHIKIDINEENDEEIVVSIIDDGIGRKKAKEIKQKSLHNHKSRAIQIIEERIAVLKELQSFVIRIDITDLYDENNAASGTAVKIKFSK